MRRFVTGVFLVLSCFAFTGWSQDNVTIPKSRLEELERKEKELQGLKQNQPAQPPQANTAAPAPLPISPQPTPVAAAKPGPPLTTLPPFAEGQKIEAVDLASYFKQDKAAADQRFKNRKMVVHGRIVGFEKPMLVRNYKVLLDTGDRETKVLCDFMPDLRYNAIHTIGRGSELIGLEGNLQTTLAKVGQVVLITGKCKGLKDNIIDIDGSDMRRELAP